MRTEQERAQIRSLIQTPQWATLEMIAEEMCSKIKSDVPVKDSQWETLRDAVLAEGKVQGIRHLLQELKRDSSYDATI